jgi:basic membrane lipoprotein Med (substrate-binding protein (PBP1-ABC) superfamily)
MKRVLIATLVFFCFALVHSQRTVDQIFSKYSDNEGFMALTISGDLLKLVRKIDSDDKDFHSWPSEINEIRILAQQDDNLKVENFYEKIMESIDFKKYEEFVRVQKSGQNLIMLVRSEGRVFKEFLVVAGGEDNVLIQINGRMTISEAKRFSEGIKDECCNNIIIRKN